MRLFVRRQTPEQACDVSKTRSTPKNIHTFVVSAFQICNERCPDNTNSCDER